MQPWLFKHGNPAAIAFSFRPVALRPRFSPGLPFTRYFYFQKKQYSNFVYFFSAWHPVNIRTFQFVKF